MKTEIQTNTTIVLPGAEFPKDAVTEGSDFALAVEKCVDLCGTPMPDIAFSSAQIVAFDPGIPELKIHSAHIKNGVPTPMSDPTAVVGTEIAGIPNGMQTPENDGSLQPHLPNHQEMPIAPKTKLSAITTADIVSISSAKILTQTLSSGYSEIDNLESSAEHPVSDKKLPVQADPEKPDQNGNFTERQTMPSTIDEPTKNPAEKGIPNITMSTKSAKNSLFSPPPTKPQSSTDGQDTIPATHQELNITNRVHHSLIETAQKSTNPIALPSSQPAPPSSPVATPDDYTPTSGQEFRTMAAPDIQINSISVGKNQAAYPRIVGSFREETAAVQSVHIRTLKPTGSDQIVKTSTHSFTKNISQTKQSTVPKPIAIETAQNLKLSDISTLTDIAPTEFPNSAPPTSSITPALTSTSVNNTQHIIRTIVDATPGLQDGPIELTLSPEELGRVRMTMHGGDGNMSVIVLVERPETLDLLRRNIELLASQLREIGYDDVSFDFTSQKNTFATEDTMQQDDDNDDNPPSNSDHPLETIRHSLTEPGRIDIRL